MLQNENSDLIAQTYSRAKFVNSLFVNSSFPKYNIHLSYLFKKTTKNRAKQYPESVVGALDN